MRSDVTGLVTVTHVYFCSTAKAVDGLVKPSPDGWANVNVGWH
jgi:hypothetical protein